MSQQFDEPVQEHKQAKQVDLRHEENIKIEFHMCEKNWPFIQFLQTFRRRDSFFIVEEKIRQHHGPISNIEFFTEPSLRKKVEYHFADSIESKIEQLNVAPAGGEPKILLYYRYDNAYEWPLLSS